MDTDGLHVVFGVGQVGTALSARLAEMGVPVRAVSRRRPAQLPDHVEWRSADVTDPNAAAEAAAKATVIYQCLNAPYTRWPELFPPLQRAVLHAAQRADALLVSLENVYGYGPTQGVPLTETLPLAATTTKGRTRAAMTRELMTASAAGRVRIAIGRAADFFGPGVTETTLGERFFGNAVAGRRVDLLGNPDLAHTYSYVPDIAAGLATLGTDPRAVGRAWHLPGPATVSSREIVDLVAGRLGRSVRIRRASTALLRTVGLVNPLMREVAEMAYQFEEPFILDTTAYESTFGPAGTPLAEAVAATVAWYRDNGRGR
jgi:nucleoside-diphosphate-sugar epimerase